MVYDLKKQRKKLTIKITDIAEKFGMSRAAVYLWENKGTYPQEVKNWFDTQQAMKDGKSFNLLEMFRKFKAKQKGKDQAMADRLHKIELKLGMED